MRVVGARDRLGVAGAHRHDHGVDQVGAVVGEDLRAEDAAGGARDAASDRADAADAVRSITTTLASASAARAAALMPALPAPITIRSTSLISRLPRLDGDAPPERHPLLEVGPPRA